MNKVQNCCQERHIVPSAVMEKQMIESGRTGDDRLPAVYACINFYYGINMKEFQEKVVIIDIFIVFCEYYIFIDRRVNIYHNNINGMPGPLGRG